MNKEPKPLNQCEAMRVSMDYLAQGDAVLEVHYFVHEYQFQIGEFVQELTHYRTLESKHVAGKIAFNEIHLQTKTSDNEIKQLAMQAAGVAVMKSKHALQEEYCVLAKHGQAVSDSLISYVQTRVPGITELLLNNRLYRFKGPHLSRSLKSGKNISKRTLLYATDNDYLEFARDMFEWKRQDNRQADAVAVPPIISDWEDLLQDILTTAKF